MSDFPPNWQRLKILTISSTRKSMVIQTLSCTTGKEQTSASYLRPKGNLET